MKPDLHLILHKEVTDHRLTAEQSQQIATRYQEIQEIQELTEGERHAIFHAWMDEHFYKRFDLDDERANAIQPVQPMKVIEKEETRIKGQQVLF